ncbi:3-oxoacyl-ACP synthase [Oscillospiraceae bacterium LTW-04]|nr:3-oxoacyl-ACP synthase [Oscillospiraceae bacterium MB24-C1]
MKTVNIGIRSMGCYVPPGIRDSAWISAASDIPEAVVREKFGIKLIHKAQPEETVSFMGVQAARQALGDFDPAKLDMVVYCGSEYKDYYLFNCAAKIQHELGAKNATAFEIHNLCSAGVWSLKVLKSMMIQDPDLKHVLLVSSSKEGDLINYKDSQSRFMFNFGDGAAAVLLERDLNENVILESAMIVDGQFATDVCVPGVGCVNMDHILHMPPENRYLKVMDIKSMKERLDPITLGNFNQVITRAAAKSGYDSKSINFIAPIFMKRSILNHILSEFDLTEENSFVLEEYGHCQSADCFISLIEGVKSGRLKDGDLAVMVAAGTGYTWAATAVRWGKVPVAD